MMNVTFSKSRDLIVDKDLQTQTGKSEHKHKHEGVVARPDKKKWSCCGVQQLHFCENKII
jgi:hypothetical protein